MLSVLLMCTEDQASVNIRDRLLEVGDFREVDTFEGRPVRFGHGMFLFEKTGLHLYLDNVDREIRSFLDGGLLEGLDVNTESNHPLDLLVFLSKHRSEKLVRSLTVHPPGNYLSADHGGRPGFLPPSAPREMTAALKALYREKKALGIKDQTTYEVTHHGPVVSSPCFFIEIGSDETRWEVPLLGEAIARALISGDVQNAGNDIPVAIGVGGGHYAPRFTDRAMRKKYCFGHMIADYILSRGEPLEDLIRMARDATRGAKYAFVHRSKRNEEFLVDIESVIEDSDLEMV